jgi:hypothetical protein
VLKKRIMTIAVAAAVATLALIGVSTGQRRAGRRRPGSRDRDLPLQGLDDLRLAGRLRRARHR